ncbi:class II D-tagatose-bisphosphate aldolase non-catalytic subunit [Fusibacter sp. JL298sf-3]
MSEDKNKQFQWEYTPFGRTPVVGSEVPALTFALREALFALEAIERELILERHSQSHLTHVIKKLCKRSQRTGRATTRGATWKLPWPKNSVISIASAGGIGG